jgi:predicted short-subunit dehydrogenase-like oxidoreductase (DUF2520 family)
MKIVIIGSGNVATSLGRLSAKAGHRILQVYSRDLSHALQLAASLNAEPVSTADAIVDNADLYLVAIKDEALENISSWLHTGHRLIAHTAGSVSIHVLEKVSSSFGVIYPFQSIRRETLPPAKIPILVDGNNADSLHILKNFAGTISDQVVEAGDGYRKKYHLAAVITNNFTNYLYTVTEAYCKKENIDFRLLIPLISETATRLTDCSPRHMQTGPAIRNDQTTIGKHLELLKEYPDIKKLYTIFTAQIAEHYK